MNKQQPHQPGEQQYKEKAQEFEKKGHREQPKGEQPQETGVSNRPLPEELHRQEQVPPPGKAKK